MINKKLIFDMSDACSIRYSMIHLVRNILWEPFFSTETAMVLVFKPPNLCSTLLWRIFKFSKMDKNWFYLIEQASDMSKIKLLFIIYACCLNKTTKTINELTNEQPSSHFFLTDPLFILIMYYVILVMWINSIYNERNSLVALNKKNSLVKWIAPRLETPFL